MRFLVFEPLLIKEADLSDDPEANAKYLEVWQKLQENMQSGMVVRPLVATRTLVAAVVSLLVIGSFWFYFFAGEKETVISTAYNQIEKLTLPTAQPLPSMGIRP